jgi:multiple sugar transport system permease protein
MPSTDPRRSPAWRAVPAALVAVAFVVPLALIVGGSLRPAGLPPSPSPSLFPQGATLDNYVAVLETEPLAHEALVSLLTAAIAVPLGVVVASWAGFAIARLPRRAAMTLACVVVAAASTPSSALFVGRLVVFRWLGVTATPVPLIAPALLGVSPLLVLLFAWSYATIPGSLYDLGKESGLGPFATWWRIALPLRAGVASIAAAIAFVLNWGDFMNPLVYVYDERWYTLPIGLAMLAALPPTDQPLMLAAAVLTLLPVGLALSLAGWRLQSWRST